MSEFNEVGEILQRVAQDLDFSLWGLTSCPCLEKQTFSAVNESGPPAQDSLLPSLLDCFVLCWPIPDNTDICSWTYNPLGHKAPGSWKWQTSACIGSRQPFFPIKNNVCSYLHLVLAKEPAVLWSALEGSLWLCSGSVSLMLTVKGCPACCFLDKMCKAVILPQSWGTA